MNDLLKQCALAYQELMTFRYHFVLGRKGVQYHLMIEFPEECFRHLAGLHKTGVEAFKMKKNVLQSVLSGKVCGNAITDATLGARWTGILKESASGGLISSVDDYMKFQEALCREDVLISKRTSDLMRLDQLSGSMRDGYSYTNIGMGYGLGVRTIINQAACGCPAGFGPYGWGGAAGTYGSIDPENQLTFFYAQQYFGPDDLRLHNALRNVIYSNIK